MNDPTPGRLHRLCPGVLTVEAEHIQCIDLDFIC